MCHVCGLLDPFVLNVGPGFGVGSGCLVAEKMWGGNFRFGFGKWVSHFGLSQIQNVF